MVNCPDCGGEIDENNLTCKKCGRKFSREEYNNLLENSLLESIVLDDFKKSYENLVKEIDSLEGILKEEKKEIEETNIDNIKLKEKEKLLYSYVLKKENEIREQKEEIENLKKSIDEMFERKDFGANSPVMQKLVSFSKEIKDLKDEIIALRNENAKYKEEIENIGKILEIKNGSPISDYVKNLVDENRSLKLDIENLQKRIDLQKKLWENWLNTQDEKIKNLAEYEMKVKEQELMVERAIRDLEIKESALSKTKVENINPVEIEILKDENSKLREEIQRLQDLLDIFAKTGKLQENVLDIRELEKLRAENKSLKSQIEIMDKTLKDIQEKIKFKEEELSRREQDLMYREAKLQEQLKELESQHLELEELKRLEEEHKIKDLEELVKKKEIELREKEKYLEMKEKELKAKERGLIEEELPLAIEEIKAEIRQEKVRTGTRRLDDLLYGGFPIGSNILIYGPAYTGKEILIYSFLAEGLRKGIPSIVILVDKTLEIFKEDVRFVLPTWDTYEEKGLVKYIDAYSRSIGDRSAVPNVIYIDSQTDVNSILENVDRIAEEFKKKYPYYRVAFLSLTNIVVFLDPQSTIKFLQSFTTKRKRDRAVSLYLLEKGVVEENALQMVSSTMDGQIEFKSEMGKVYLTVKGVTEVQSRSWIEITPSKSGIIMGSFTLGHIR